jgi:hypothetical protein
MFMHNCVHQNSAYLSGKLLVGAMFCILAGLSTSAPSALAQSVAATASPAASNLKTPTPAKNAGTPKISSKPAWQDLTNSQQVSLQPLATKWSTLSEVQKHKWIAIAVNYPTLSVADQTKLHSHMTEWVSLSQQQRSQARLNFAEAIKISPTQKAANWEAYQALGPEEKKKLMISATPRPLGAAAATKPVAPQKLAKVPVTRATLKESSKMAAAGHVVNRNTLLPRTQSLTEPTPPQKN